LKPWPIHQSAPLFPDSPGCFGVFRRHDRHTGVDLYCNLGSRIVAVEDGVVVKVEEFTGAEAGSPWWNRTQAVLIEGESGVLVYGEVESLVEVGQKVKTGDIIAHVPTPVLKEFKGRPMVMLHFEQMTHGSRETLWWRLEQPQPENLLDPTNLLLETANGWFRFFDLREWDGERYLVSGARR
jgi:murein DD-endopeptidase MepM/ murein hydrolase activator NlpD